MSRTARVACSRYHNKAHEKTHFYLVNSVSYIHSAYGIINLGIPVYLGCDVRAREAGASCGENQLNGIVLRPFDKLRLQHDKELGQHEHTMVARNLNMAYLCIPVEHVQTATVTHLGNN